MLGASLYTGKRLSLTVVWAKAWCLLIHVYASLFLSCARACNHIELVRVVMHGSVTRYSISIYWYHIDIPY